MRRQAKKKFKFFLLIRNSQITTNKKTFYFRKKHSVGVGVCLFAFLVFPKKNRYSRKTVMLMSIWFCHSQNTFFFFSDQSHFCRFIKHMIINSSYFILFLFLLSVLCDVFFLLLSLACCGVHVCLFVLSFVC